jgi:predicted dehydrogenase
VSRLRLGVLGCGFAAREIHAARLRALDERVGVVAVADARADAARRGAEVFGGVPVADGIAGLAASGCQALAVLTPVHGEHVREALLADLDVFVEKPMCETAAEAAELGALARERGRVLMTGAMRRHERAVHEAARLVPTVEPLRWVEIRDYASAARAASAPAGDLDEPLLQDRLAQAGAASPRARRVLQTLLLEFVHALSALDVIRPVSGCADAAASPDGWSLAGRLVLEDGAPCLFGVAEFGVPRFPVFEARLTFVGEGGLVELRLADANAPGQEAELSVTGADGVPAVMRIGDDPYAREWEAFLDAAEARDVDVVGAGVRDVERLWEIAERAGVLAEGR